MPYLQRGESLRHSLTGSEGPPSHGNGGGPSEVSWGLHPWVSLLRNNCETLRARARHEDGASRAPTLAKPVILVKIQRASPLRQRALDLFASSTKFDGGTGWPSFWRPLNNAIGTRRDTFFGVLRRAVQPVRRAPRPRFRRRPAPTGLRYCINGVALTSKASLTPNRPEYTPLRVLLMIVSSCVLLVLPAPDFEVGAK